MTGVSHVGDVVTYTITAPSSTWGTSFQGTYTISVVADSVQDTDGNGIAAVESLGTFLVDTVVPTATLTSGFPT